MPKLLVESAKTMMNKYIMTRSILSRIILSNGKAKCKVCGVELKVGDAVLSKCRKKARQVHEGCRPVNW